jgi:hypothetical protein
MKHPRVYAKIKAAQRLSGFSENGPEKQLTRNKLIDAAHNYLQHPPTAIFTFPGIHGFCVEAFRKVWPRTRIVGIDRQMPAIRMSKAHFYSRESAIGPLENELIHANLGDYAERKTQRLYRVRRNGQKYALFDSVPPFDYPRFELIFLDTTALYNTKTGILKHAAMLINQHTARNAIAGITLVLGKPNGTIPDVDVIVSDFRSLIKRGNKLVSEPMIYVTNQPMLFFILSVND